MNVSAEIAADRARIEQICASPEAASNLKAALAIALAGATVSQARAALLIANDPMTADEVAASINKQFGAKK